MNKPVCFGLSVLDLRKRVIDEFQDDYVTPKYGENAKLCYMDTDSFIVFVKADDIYSIWQKMLKQDFTIQILYQTDHCLKEIIKKYLDL